MLVDFRSFSFLLSIPNPQAASLHLPLPCLRGDRLSQSRGPYPADRGILEGSSSARGAEGEGAFRVLSMNEMPRAERKDPRPPMEAATDMLCDLGQVTASSGL